MRRALVLAALVASLAGASAATAAPARTSLSNVEDEVMCVTCRIPLNIADSPQADEERAFIRQRIAAGDTKAQVKAALVGQYGPRVLATPSGHGVDLAAWLVPGILVVLALAGLAVALPRWRHNRATTGTGAGTAAPALTEADARRLDDELARFDA